MNVAVVLLVLAAGAFGNQLDGSSESIQGDPAVGEVNDFNQTFLVDIYEKFGPPIVTHLCNGVLLDRNLVLAPMNCFFSPVPVLAVYIFGTSFSIKQILFHDNPSKFHNNTALVFLKEEVRGIKFPKLPSMDFDDEGYLTLYTTTHRNNTLQLQILDVESRSMVDCGLVAFDLDDVLCAGDKKNNSTVKAFGLGSGLIKKDPKLGNVLVGIAFERNMSPALFTRVKYYTDWINEHRKPDGVEPASNK